MANPTAHSAVIEQVSHAKDDILNSQNSHVFLHPIPNIPASARKFFASVSSPAEILSSKLVSKVQGIDVIEGGYNHVHNLNLDTGDPDLPFSFILRIPIEPDINSRLQTLTCVGCMLYCQGHPDLNIPSPAIYAYSCTRESEFIAMEYIDGDMLDEVWMVLPEEEKINMASQVAEIMRTMRTKTVFSMIGGISPDGSACPLVLDLDVLNNAWGVIDGLDRLYNIGPYDSVQEYIRSIFDREFHYMDQLLHKDMLSAHETELRLDMSIRLSNLTPEDAFERMKSKRDDFIAHPYNQCKYPSVLWHGDLKGWNVIVSHSSPRRILAIIDWDFGGSQALPFADKDFEVCAPGYDDDVACKKDTEEIHRFQILINELAGGLPVDVELDKSVLSTRWHIINQEALTPSGEDTCASTCLDDSGVDAGIIDGDNTGLSDKEDSEDEA